MDRETLKTTAEQMMQKPKGLLAMDESSPTCAKRFSALNIPETEENRIRYRELIVCLLYTSPSPRDDELSRMPSSA